MKKNFFSILRTCLNVLFCDDMQVLRLATVDEHRLLSSGLDQVTALWRPDDGELIAHLK